jgi:gas vesicle protein
MTHKQMHTKEFIIGAAVGSLLGSVAAILIAPKEGKKLRQDICETCSDLTERTQDLARRGKSIAQSIGSQSNQWAGKAKEAVEGAKKSVRGWMGQEEEEVEENSARDFLIGGIAGGIVGAAIGLLLAPKAGEELRHDIIEKYDDVSDTTQAFAKRTQSKANKWIDLARQVVDDLTEEAHDKGEDLVDRAKGLINHKRIHDVMDWASLGVRVWQKMKKR